MIKLIRRGIPQLLIIWLSGCFMHPQSQSTADLPAVENFDLPRYCGTWHEIARLPHRFEEGMSGVSATYTLRSDGRITVINRGIRNGKLREIRGIAEAAANAGGSGELRVSFFRPFYGKYRIIKLAADMSMAMVTSGTRDFLWILSRDQNPEQSLVDEWCRAAGRMGFDTSKLIFPDRKKDPSASNRIPDRQAGRMQKHK